jgi:hypothetical protein
MKMAYRLMATVLTSGSLFLAGCEDGGSDSNTAPAATPAVSIAGTWTGAYAMSDGSQSRSIPVTCSFSQNGNTVAGTSFWGGDSACDVSGRVDGSFAVLTFDYRQTGWASDVVQGSVVGNSMTLGGGDGTFGVSYTLTRSAASAVLPVATEGEGGANMTKEQALRQQSR